MNIHVIFFHLRKWDWNNVFEVAATYFTFSDKVRQLLFQLLMIRMQLLVWLLWIMKTFFCLLSSSCFFPHFHWHALCNSWSYLTFTSFITNLSYHYNCTPNYLVMSPCTHCLPCLVDYGLTNLWSLFGIGEQNLTACWSNVKFMCTNIFTGSSYGRWLKLYQILFLWKLFFIVHFDTYGSMYVCIPDWRLLELLFQYFLHAFQYNNVFMFEFPLSPGFSKYALQIHFSKVHQLHNNFDLFILPME